MSRRRAGRKRGRGLLPASAEPEKRVPRRLRVEGDVRHELLAALSRLRDPRLGSVSITRVLMSDDLQHARVLVRLGVEAEQGQEQRVELMRGLRAASGRLRRHIGRQLALRYTPELRFVYDEGPDAARRVDELLDEIRREEESREA